MPKLPSDIQKWNKRWGTDVKYCCPSTGGAVGIIFVWTTQDKWNYAKYEPKDAAFIIKPIQGSAAPTKFAETILSRIGGAQSPNSVPIKRPSDYGKSLFKMLDKFSQSESDTAVKNRWQAVLNHYRNADVFLIQETQKGIQELGDAYRPEAYKNDTDGILKILTNQTLMMNLGKLFAADALIGNGDRLSNMNTGNIVFNRDGTISSIDSTTVLTNYNAIINDQTQTQVFTLDATPFDSGHWTQGHVLNSGNTQVMNANQQNAAMNGQGMPTLAPGGGISEIFDITNWWTTKFRKELESGLAKHSPGEKSPGNNIWFQAELWFKLGVNEGIRQIDSKLSGLNWLLMKNKYKSYVSRYGGDPNLDWMNFKVRRKYVKLRKKGLTEQQTITAIQDYVKRKMPGL